MKYARKAVRDVGYLLMNINYFYSHNIWQQDEIDLAAIVIQKLVPTCMHGIYFILRFFLLNPAPSATARPPRAHPVKPSTGIWLQGLERLGRSLI